MVLGSATVGCTSIDPGPNFVVAAETFDEDYFYCHVEPEYIVAKKCGPGDPALDVTNSCHFSSVVSGMSLFDHPAIDCGGGDHPVDRTQVGTGSLAQTNFTNVSFEMSHDVVHAPLLVRPSGSNHPRPVISIDDPQVLTLLENWAKQ